jgi:hypothetical protein
MPGRVLLHDVHVRVPAAVKTPFTWFVRCTFDTCMNAVG